MRCGSNDAVAYNCNITPFICDFVCTLSLYCDLFFPWKNKMPPEQCTSLRCFFTWTGIALHHMSRFFYWYLCYIIESFYWFDALFRYFKIWNMISFSLMGTTLYGNKLLQIGILRSASDRIDVTYRSIGIHLRRSSGNVWFSCILCYASIKFYCHNTDVTVYMSHTPEYTRSMTIQHQ